jgi:hypothetical protein
MCEASCSNPVIIRFLVLFAVVFSLL